MQTTTFSYAKTSITVDSDLAETMAVKPGDHVDYKTAEALLAAQNKRDLAQIHLARENKAARILASLNPPNLETFVVQ
jgi:hypothetical protein